MFLRERSIREMREAARKNVPHALSQSFSELEATLLRAVDAHVAGLREYIVLAHNQLGSHLQALLERAAAVQAQALPAAEPGTPAASTSAVNLTEKPAVPDARRNALTELRALEQRLEQLRGELARIATTEPTAPAAAPAASAA